jgi:hypothetical protein
MVHLLLEARIPNGAPEQNRPLSSHALLSRLRAVAEKSAPQMSLEFFGAVTL